MPVILGIDPGGTGGHTGAVLIEYTAQTAPDLLDSWAIPGDMDSFREWWDCDVLGYGFDIVVCEKFVNRNIAGADLTPLLFEGAVRFLVPDVVLQPAAGKNSAVDDAAMTRLGFPKSLFKGDHHGDRAEAARHSLWWLKKNLHRPTLEKGWPRD